MTDRLTENELAARCRVSASTVQKWRRLKKGPPFIKVGGERGSIRYLIKDVEAWEERHRVQTSE